ncbi:unnamed protein product [Mycena citricolor]|uniref:Cysteine proteinase 1, mitochondrial n=1 Tax=Mycena citricolor TaxID=2018698 RepID=A0AAD2HPL1_9AGAR|nr:unnamed protein product [Mycena citricolor]
MGSAPSKATGPYMSMYPAPPLAPENEKLSAAAVRPERELEDRLQNLTIAASAPRSLDGALTASNISTWESTASAPVHAVTRAVLARTDVNALQRREAHRADHHTFNTVLDFKTGPIANQRGSGRCWLFAATNVMRYPVMRKLNLDKFELSQNYLYFYDKLEKANYFLEQAITFADVPLNSRLLSHLSTDLISDGGQFDMLINLIEKHGIVPQDVYPESFHSMLSAPMNTILKTKIREHGLVLRQAVRQLRAQGLTDESVLAVTRAQKEKLMAETYRMLTAMLGVPMLADEAFTWSYHDKDGKYGQWTGTPKQFAKTFIGSQVSESISLINDPRNAYSEAYTVTDMGNVWGGRPVVYVNTSAEMLKSLVVKMIKAGEPVFFGCDVLKHEDRFEGFLDLDLFEYEKAFDIKFPMNKAQRLEVGESIMTHAMVFTGVHLDEQGRAVRFKVENAWGTGVARQGWFTMGADWFEQWVYQIVVPKRFVPAELVKAFETGHRTEFKPWDPMGALA